jgi:drug/metabolite transporter (DMT)-like permease
VLSEPDGLAAGRDARRAQLVGSALALVATVVWSGGFLLARGLRDDVPPVALNFWRWAIATTVLAPFAARAVVANWPAIRRHWRYVLAAAALGVTVYNTLVYVAGHTTQAVNLSLIGVAGPIFIVVLAGVLGIEAVTRRRVVGIVIAVAGVVVLVSGGSLTALSSLDLRVGDLWMLAATLVFAGYTLLVRRRPADLPALAFLLATFAAGTLLAAPAYVVELVVVGPFPVTAGTVGGLLYLGAGASVVAYFAWNTAIDLAGAGRPALIYYLIPAFTAAGGAMFLHESLRLAQFVSMALIVGGTAIGALGRGETGGGGSAVSRPEAPDGRRPVRPRGTPPTRRH